MRRHPQLDLQVLRAVQEAQLAEHGGAAGTRDAGLFESALARPQNLVAYQATSARRAPEFALGAARRAHGSMDAAELAASYGDGIARNHPFIDGNKRTAFVAVELFLALNGQRLTATDVNCVMTMLAVAAGELDAAAFAAWLRDHLRPR